MTTTASDAYACPLLLKQLLVTPIAQRSRKEIVSGDVRFGYPQLVERISRLGSGLARGAWTRRHGGGAGLGHASIVLLRGTGEFATLGAQNVTSVQLDIADPASVTAAFDGIAAAGGPLDVVINNAGISGDGLAIDQPIADFDAVMGTSLRGVWLVATEAARRWRGAQRGDAIVNIASLQGERTAPRLAAYSA